jgi:hypothetical protein
LRRAPEFVATFPCGKNTSVVASCCPVLFKRTLGVAIESIQIKQLLKYLWDIATCDSIFVCYSESPEKPVLVASGLYYFSVTVWSYDGRWLIASFRDGFCTILHFAAPASWGWCKGTSFLPQSMPADAAVVAASGLVGPVAALPQSVVINKHSCGNCALALRGQGLKLTLG